MSRSRTAASWALAGFYRPQNFLHSLYVDGRGRGIGKALLDYVAAAADGPVSLKVQAPEPPRPGLLPPRRLPLHRARPRPRLGHRLAAAGQARGKLICRPPRSVAVYRRHANGDRAMIAMLLAAQLVAGLAGYADAASHAPDIARWLRTSGDLVQILPRLDARTASPAPGGWKSPAEPAALYRKGDRPATA